MVTVAGWDAVLQTQRYSVIYVDRGGDLGTGLIVKLKDHAGNFTKQMNLTSPKAINTRSVNWQLVTKLPGCCQVVLKKALSYTY